MADKKKSNYVKSATKPEAQQRAIRTYYAKKESAKSKHVSAPYPHFRYYKKSGHPALIVGEHSVDEYRFRKVMHGEREGDRKNEIVYPNPDWRDPEPMYIARRVRHDKKNAFGNRPFPWKYPNKKK